GCDLEILRSGEAGIVGNEKGYIGVRSKITGMIALNRIVNIGGRGRIKNIARQAGLGVDREINLKRLVCGKVIDRHRPDKFLTIHNNLSGAGSISAITDTNRQRNENVHE